MGAGPRWSPAEVDQLYSLAGDIPRPVLTRVFNQWAVQNGFPPRSTRAIQNKAQALGLSLQASGTFLTSGGIAAILGLPHTTVEGWYARYQDFPTRSYYRQRTKYVNRDDLRKWAKRHKHLFGGLEHSSLVMLLEDEKLVDSILEQYPVRPTGVEAFTKKVKCVDTGRVWPSMMAAAKELHVTHAGVWKALHDGHRCAGHALELVH